MIRKTFIFIVQCVLLTAFSSCTNEYADIEDEVVAFHLLDIEFTDNMQTRAIDANGYDGVVKKVLVAGDEVQIYKDNVYACKATKQTDGTWVLSAPLTLMKSKRTEVKMTYTNENTQNVEAHAIAYFNRTVWETTATGCWGEIGSNNNRLNAVLKHSNSLICIEKVTSAVGTVSGIQAVVGGTRVTMNTVNKNWLWETLGEASANLTAFVVTVDGTEVEVPLESPQALEAHTQYTYQLYLLPGEFSVMPGNPASWQQGEGLGNQELTPINSLSEITDMDGEYILTSNITLTEPHTPIGTDKKPFTGVLDGNGYRISGLEVSGNVDYAGLFGVLSGDAQVKNIHFENAIINTTGIAAGILAGKATVRTRFDICSVTGTDGNPNEVTIETEIGNTYAGGLIGHVASSKGETASFSRCWVTYTDIKVTSSGGDDTHCGGLLGRADNVTVIASYCYHTNAEASGTAYSHYVGGFIGYTLNNAICCYSSHAREVSASAVNATTNFMGDFIGHVIGRGSIEYCYATRNDNLATSFIGKSDVNASLTNNVGHTTDIDLFNVLNDDNTGISYNNKFWKSSNIWVIPNENGGSGFPYINLSYNGE